MKTSPRPFGSVLPSDPGIPAARVEPGRIHSVDVPFTPGSSPTRPLGRFVALLALLALPWFGAPASRAAATNTVPVTTNTVSAATNAVPATNAVTAAKAAPPPPEPPPYTPHPAAGTIGRVERLDPDLDDLIAPGTTVELLAEGFDWVEGPVWSARGDYLLFADVPRNVVWRWREFEGLSEYLKPSGYTARPWSGGESGANGLTLDNDGRLILCQHGDRQVSRLKGRSLLEPLATNFQGRRFNSPNDVVLHSNGELYFTDPTYGLQGGTNDPKRELPYQGVFRVSRRGRVSLLVSDLTFPNGIAFSPDERRLYVAVSDPARAHYMVYDLQRDGSLGGGRILFDATPLVAGRPGLPDGLKVDRKGNLWATGPGGVLVITPEGRHLGTINTGEATGNCAWGGDGSVLYITANSRLCRVRTQVKGEIPGPLPERRQYPDP